MVDGRGNMMEQKWSRHSPIFVTFLRKILAAGASLSLIIRCYNYPISIFQFLFEQPCQPWASDYICLFSILPIVLAVAEEGMARIPWSVKYWVMSSLPMAWKEQKRAKSWPGRKRGLPKQTGTSSPKSPVPPQNLIGIGPGLNPWQFVE